MHPPYADQVQSTNGTTQKNALTFLLARTITCHLVMVQTSGKFVCRMVHFLPIPGVLDTLLKPSFPGLSYSHFVCEKAKFILIK